MDQCHYFFHDANGWILVFTSYFNILSLFMFLFLVLVTSAVQLIFFSYKYLGSLKVR